LGLVKAKNRGDFKAAKSLSGWYNSTIKIEISSYNVDTKFLALLRVFLCQFEVFSPNLG